MVAASGAWTCPPWRSSPASRFASSTALVSPSSLRRSLMSLVFSAGRSGKRVPHPDVRLAVGAAVALAVDLDRHQCAGHDVAAALRELQSAPLLELGDA